jgi:L-asparaginase/Glu-tRNA(Gln) amidotransferase subunit D
MGPVVVRSSGVGVAASSDEPVCVRNAALSVSPSDNCPQKARVLLMLALTRTSNLEEIKRMFAEY